MGWAPTRRSGSPRPRPVRDIETVLESTFGLSLVVVVRSHRQLRNVVTRAPDGFGAAPDIHHSDVIFLKAPLTSRQALRAVELRDGVDQAWPGTGVLYFSRLSERLSQSRMSRIASTSQYQNMTIRNWRTTTRLLSLLDERRAAQGARGKQRGNPAESMISGGAVYGPIASAPRLRKSLSASPPTAPT